MSQKPYSLIYQLLLGKEIIMENLCVCFRKVLDGEAVLFAGAGFSYQDRKRKRKGTVPSAIALKKNYVRKFGDRFKPYNLETISQYYINKKSPEELISKLKQIFNIRNVADHPQNNNKSSLEKDLFPINYDQVIERASESLGNDNRIEPIILSDKYIDNKKDFIYVYI